MSSLVKDFLVNSIGWPAGGYPGKLSWSSFLTKYSHNLHNGPMISIRVGLNPFNSSENVILVSEGGTVS